MCGDTCPKICRICKPKDETFETFFGTEDDPEACFVQLDCGHSFEASSLDHYMNLPLEKNEIQFKKCPRCSQPIKKCVRYQNQINSVLVDINKIKTMKLQDEKNARSYSDEVKNIYDQIMMRYIQEVQSGKY